MYHPYVSSETYSVLRVFSKWTLMLDAHHRTIHMTR